VPSSVRQLFPQPPPPPAAPTRSPCASSHWLVTAGILALLDEPETELQEYALDKLNAVVDTFWAEIADHIDRIEILYEDEGFKSRGLASLVASKVYYHLGELDDAMTYALGAGDDFDVGLHNEYG